MGEVKEVSGAKFFGGCLVFLLIIGGAVGFFYNAHKKALAREAALREALFEDYWSSLGTDKFPAEFDRVSTESRKEKQPVDKVAANFEEFSKKNEGLKEVRIHVMNEAMIVGTDDKWLRVETIHEFNNGRYLAVDYKLREQGDGSYLIDFATTTDRQVEMPLW